MNSFHGERPRITKTNINVLFSDFATVDFRARTLLVKSDPAMAMTEDMMMKALKSFVARMKEEHKKLGIEAKENEHEFYPAVDIHIQPSRNFENFLLTMLISETAENVACQITDLMFIHYIEIFLDL